MARFDSNAAQSIAPDTNLIDLVHKILMQRTPAILEKNLNMVVREEGGEQMPLNTFFAFLIIDNLLSNAIKYSKENGKVEITLLGNSTLAHCVIKDYGIGIAEADLAKLYTPFFRSNALAHKEIKGVGLGLSIVKKAAEILNADIQIESEIGKSTTIDITFKAI